MWTLARDSRTLDLNSPYAYLLFATHFSDSCIVAESSQELVGFVLGFTRPNRRDTLFVWQIAVAPPFRGNGVAVEMLAAILERRAAGLCHSGLEYVEATITPSNQASRKAFRALAERFQTAFDEGSAPLFSKDAFPGGEHEDEVAIRVGPIKASAAERETSARTAAATAK